MSLKPATLRYQILQYPWATTLLIYRHCLSRLNIVQWLALTDIIRSCFQDVFSFKSIRNQISSCYLPSPNQGHQPSGEDFKGLWTWQPSWSLYQSFVPPTSGVTIMKFEFRWPSSFRWYVWNCWQMEDRRLMPGSLVYYNLWLRWANKQEHHSYKLVRYNLFVSIVWNKHLYARAHILQKSNKNIFYQKHRIFNVIVDVLDFEY